jgi:WD40 repeat protein
MLATGQLLLPPGGEAIRLTGSNFWVTSCGVTLALLATCLAQEPRDAGGRTLPSKLDVGARVLSVAVTPDGKHVVSGSGDNTVRLWELATGKEVRRFTGHADWVRSVAVTPDGKYVVSGSGDNTVRLLELATGQEVRRFTGHENWVWSVAVTPDGKYVVSGSGDNTVRVWPIGDLLTPGK